MYISLQKLKKFAEIVWNNEPIGSGDLVNLCAKKWAGRNRQHIQY